MQEKKSIQIIGLKAFNPGQVRLYILFISLLVWLLDVVRHNIYFHEETFFHSFVYPIYDLSFRVVIVLLLVIAGELGIKLFNRIEIQRKKIDEAEFKEELAFLQGLRVSAQEIRNFLINIKYSAVLLEEKSMNVGTACDIISENIKKAGKILDGVVDESELFWKKFKKNEYNVLILDKASPHTPLQ